MKYMNFIGSIQLRLIPYLAVHGKNLTVERIRKVFSHKVSKKCADSEIPQLKAPSHNYVEARY